MTTVVEKSATTADGWAIFEQVLFWSSEPEVVVLDFNKFSKVIAVSASNIDGSGYFGAKVSVAQFRNYLRGKFDLRFLFLRPDRWTWYHFDLPSLDPVKVKLRNVELTQKRISMYVPGHGFFARDHSEEYEAFPTAPRDVQRFLVNGEWDMREFSRFHAQISDLYAFSQGVEEFADANTPVEKKRDIVKAFVKPWEGGGSYVGFFRSLAKAGGEDARPDIKAIQWASPGYMDVVGEAEAFEKLISLVDHFGRNRRAIMEAYDHLWSYLQEFKLLGARKRGDFATDSVLKEVESRGKDLGKVLGATAYSTLKRMAGEDAIVTAKVLLATERRVSRLYDFFSEGRVAVEGLKLA
ncbi:hypothetical protein [Sphingomonas sp. 2SG]|uniref:hypothetical protein n=1 Tax=Sphingomonas sp. 2SG TaxID=2502201 RepID=UPI0010F43BA1|nr:hypothetical protein [Sphingomonas sp. 2SG]